MLRGPLKSTEKNLKNFFFEKKNFSKNEIFFHFFLFFSLKMTKFLRIIEKRVFVIKTCSYHQNVGFQQIKKLRENFWPIFHFLPVFWRNWHFPQVKNLKNEWKWLKWHFLNQKNDYVVKIICSQNVSKNVFLDL